MSSKVPMLSFNGQRRGPLYLWMANCLYAQGSQLIGPLKAITDVVVNGEDSLWVRRLKGKCRQLCKKLVNSMQDLAHERPDIQGVRARSSNISSIINTICFSPLLTSSVRCGRLRANYYALTGSRFAQIYAD